MKEASIKDYLIDEAKKRKLLCIKLAPTGSNGWPDWLVLGEDGVHGFIELKRPGEVPTKLQLRRIDKLQCLGHMADWADSLAGVKRFLDEIAGPSGEAVGASVSEPDSSARVVSWSEICGAWDKRGNGTLTS